MAENKIREPKPAPVVAEEVTPMVTDTTEPKKKPAPKKEKQVEKPKKEKAPKEKVELEKNKLKVHLENIERIKEKLKKLK